MKVRLNIDKIPEDCYQKILLALREQFGEGDYGNWVLEADKEMDKDDSLIEQYMKYDWELN